MELVKTKGSFNDYTWSGLTLGKVLAIKHALMDIRGQDKLSPVQYDVLMFLINEEIEHI